MKRRILLRRYEVVNQNFRWLGAFALRIEATSPDGSADPNIFLFQRTPLNPYTQIAENRFLGVCSPVDMYDYPIGAPDFNRTYPFFRAASFEVLLRSTRLAEKLWENVKRRIIILLEALYRLDQLTNTSSILLESGTAPEIPPDDGDSVSDAW